MDGNGNGKLSLAELDGGIRDVLGCGEVFAAKPAIARAFHAARGSTGGEESNDDYVEFKEFRLFLV